MAQVKHTDPFKLGWTEDIVLPAHTKLLRMDKLRLEALKMLHKTVLPITYQPKFYERLYGQARDHSYLAEHRGVLVGDISCRFEAEKDNRMYIMTLCVLEPYRKNGIGATLLRNVMQDAYDTPEVESLVLHVQVSNAAALEFYKKRGFENKELVKDYYAGLKEDAYMLVLDTKQKE
eukprot:TRINITY_DN6187_c0_g1_i7.p1 TRINITY_DN6187_c0_g1~~TRINITY_DN6187_c0_g1_i7.p1  ORF type:complete len:193 (+),score=107.51 TRINITY_DN6187_c0_g1_i7:54-581(+)